MKSVPWMQKAIRVTHRFKSHTSGHYYLYIVLLSGVHGEQPGYALYVGQTAKTPEERFRQHKSGYKASRYVKRYGERLLPGLYSHLIPLQREEAQHLEYEIAEALKSEGIPVFGGH